MKTLEIGRKYNLDAIELIDWTVGDGSGNEGYDVWDYFHSDGSYKGPDIYGIEPVVEIA